MRTQMRMNDSRRILTPFFVTWLVLTGCGRGEEPSEDIRLSVKEYRDKMKAGWIGQMVGVAWGAPVEFHFQGQIMPAGMVPAWQPRMCNDAFSQDDLHVEMTFLRTLEQYGLDCSIRQAGIDWANSTYGLAHANEAGRTNLRRGIAPPDSGHPQFTAHADDIDYQIEADFSGLIAPGMPNLSIELGEKFGRLMNYGDGVYGGQWIAAMYAAAFFENDPAKIVKTGLQVIPEGSQYHEAISDVLRWYQANPGSWEKTWTLVEDKYGQNPDYRRSSCNRDKKGDKFNIDAKLNGAYVAIGLLYGNADVDRTIIIACRCGQDSDCNASSAAGILFTTIGFSNLPERFTKELNHQAVFSRTAYNFPALVAVSEKLAREAVIRGGGKVGKDAHGDENFVIPVQRVKPSCLLQSWASGPIAQSKFTPAEMMQITVSAPGKQ
jgi:hypothetical protein